MILYSIQNSLLFLVGWCGSISFWISLDGGQLFVFVAVSSVLTATEAENNDTDGNEGDEKENKTNNETSLLVVIVTMDSVTDVTVALGNAGAPVSTVVASINLSNTGGFLVTIGSSVTSILPVAKFLSSFK